MVGFAGRVFGDTGSYTRVKLVTDLPKRPMLKVKMADPWLTVCDCSHSLTARQKYSTGTGSGFAELDPLFPLAVHGAAIQQATHRSDSFQSFMCMSQPPIAVFPGSLTKFPSPHCPRFIKYFHYLPVFSYPTPCLLSHSQPIIFSRFVGKKCLPSLIFPKSL